MFLLTVDINKVLGYEEDVTALSVISMWMMRWRGFSTEMECVCVWRRLRGRDQGFWRLC